MTSSIHFDDFLLTFERSLERVLLSASNSSSSPNDSSTGTSGINHSEIENAIKELGAVLDEHFLKIEEAIVFILTRIHKRNNKRRKSDADNKNC